MLNLLLILINTYTYGADTVIISNYGYSNTIRRRFSGSTYWEQSLNKQLSFFFKEYHLISWDSLSKDKHRYTKNTLAIKFSPFKWLKLETGLYGSRNRIIKDDGSDKYSFQSTSGFLDATSSNKLLYANYYAKYGKEKTSLAGSNFRLSPDKILLDIADIRIKVEPCTLSFKHRRDQHSSWSRKGDTIGIVTKKISIKKTYIRSGAKLGRKYRIETFSNLQQLGANVWISDSIPFNKNLGLSFSAKYIFDTLTNYSQDRQTHGEDKKNLSAKISYRPFNKTLVKLNFNTEDMTHRQVDTYYNKDINKIKFSSSLSHNFYRRPKQASGKVPGNEYLSPGSIYFSHSYTLEHLRTPDTLNALDRDKATQTLYFKLTLKPAKTLYTMLKFRHNLQLTHYLTPNYALSSNKRKTNYVSWNLNFVLDRYLNLSNDINLSFDWSEYYLDSTKNRADRTWADNFSLTFFPNALIQPTAIIKWRRYENWKMISGALSRSDVRDKINQTYSLVFIRKRKEEAYSRYRNMWREREWLRIEAFGGINIEKAPFTDRGLFQKSLFMGLKGRLRPWPYLNIHGGVKFTRSEYEAPFEASMSINSSF